MLPSPCQAVQPCAAALLVCGQFFYEWSCCFWPRTPDIILWKAWIQEHKPSYLVFSSICSNIVDSVAPFQAKHSKVKYGPLFYEVSCIFAQTGMWMSWAQIEKEKPPMSLECFSEQVSDMYMRAKYFSDLCLVRHKSSYWALWYYFQMQTILKYYCMILMHIRALNQYFFNLLFVSSCF